MGGRVRVKALAGKLKTFSSVPRTYIVEGENQKLPLDRNTVNVMRKRKTTEE